MLLADDLGIGGDGETPRVPVEFSRRERDADLPLHFAAVRAFGPLEFLHMAGSRHAVKKHLAEHPPDARRGEGLLGTRDLADAHARGHVAALIRRREHDHLHERAQIVSARREFLREKLQRLRVPHVVVRRKIIERLDEASTDKLRPHAVHKGARKIRIARVGDHPRELLPQIAVAIDRPRIIQLVPRGDRLGEHVGSRQAGLDRGLRVRCVHEIIERLFRERGIGRLRFAEVIEARDVVRLRLEAHHLERKLRRDAIALRSLLAFRRPFHRHLLALGRVDFLRLLAALDALRLAEKCREPVKFRLLPVVERMIVALRAREPHAEENLRRRARERHRVCRIAEHEARGGHHLRAAICREEFAHHRVVRLCLGDAAVHVGEQLPAALGL